MSERRTACRGELNAVPEKRSIPECEERAMGQAKSVALLSLGCAKNLVDSEVMLGFLERAGYRLVPDLEKADICIVNTCGFIRLARREAEKAIEKVLRLKEKNLRKTIVIAGCCVERFGDELKERYPGVDVWLGVRAFDRIVPAVNGRPWRPSARAFLCRHDSPRVLSTPPTWAYLKISEGCSHRCSFCAIPLIKGPYMSRPISSIVREAASLAAKGVREINLVSQDSTFFGRDRGMRDGLPRLLARLVDVPGIRWIRVLYGCPEEVSDALLEIMREPKICPYLDLPFQHSDRRVLRLMNRPMDGKKALRLLERIRGRLPDVAVRTTLIVGFPGEGRKEFADLVAFVRAARFDHLGVFTYSPEEGTSAFRLKDPVAEAEKEKRRDEIMEVQSEISASLLRRRLGTTMDVLIEGCREKIGRTAFGRTRFQAPEVDGLVKVIIGRAHPLPLPSIAKVEITSTGVYDLEGRLVR